MAKQHKVLRVKSVMERVGVSKPTIYLWMKEGKFPRPIPLGVKTVGWLEADIDEWFEQRIAMKSGRARINAKSREALRRKEAA